MIQCTVYQSLCCWCAVFRKNMFFQRAAVDTHANRNILRFTSVNHLFYAAVVTDIARIDANLINSGCHRFQCQTIIKVNIRYNRHRNCFFQNRNQAHGIHIWNRCADDLTTCRLQTLCLRRRSCKVLSRSAEHRLNADRSSAADLHAACHDWERMSFHREPPLCKEKFYYIIKSHKEHKSHQQEQTCRMDKALVFRRDRLAS